MLDGVANEASTRSAMDVFTATKSNSTVPEVPSPPGLMVQKPVRKSRYRTAERCSPLNSLAVLVHSIMNSRVIKT